MKINDITKYFFWITIIFLTISIIITIAPKIIELQNLNFSQVFNEKSANIFNLPNPRTTGLSRSLAVVNLFLILLFLDLKKLYIKNFLIVIISIFSTLVLFMQSRGTLVCYFTSLTILIFFLVDVGNNFKIKNVLILIILPILLYLSINNYVNKNKLSNEDVKINNRIFSLHTSGRIDTWNYSIKNYDYKNIFGYGPQGDRILLKDFGRKSSYGNNSSNIFVYTLLSGGIASVILLVLFFYQIFKFFIKNRKILFFNKNSIYLNFSITCLIFFSIRSIFENSFGLFSIDFLITYLSVVCIVDSTKTIKD